MAPDHSQPRSQAMPQRIMRRPSRHENRTTAMHHMQEILLPRVHDVKTRRKLRHHLRKDPQRMAPMPQMPHVHHKIIRLQPYQMPMQQLVLFRVFIKVERLAL